MSKRRRKKHRLLKAVLVLLILALIAVTGLLIVGGWTPDSSFGTVEKIGHIFRRNFSESVKDVPDTEKGYYYSVCDAEGQKIYSVLYDGITQNRTAIEVPSEDLKKIEHVFAGVMADHPEFFWLTGATKTTFYDPAVGKGYSIMEPSWTCDEREQTKRKAQVEAVVKSFLEGQNSADGDYEKVRRAYEYIIDRTEYDDTAADNQNLYSALVGKRSVCAGYSKAFQYLLKRQGIECLYVTGVNDETGEPHGWNIVKCGDRYYQVDVTWGDPVYSASEEEIPDDVRTTGYDYLCCTDQEIGRTHTIDTSYKLPVCDSDDLNYYRLNGMLYDSYDAEQCLQVMLDDIAAGNSQTIFKFTDDSLYEAAVDDLTGRLLQQAANELMIRYGLSSVSNYYQEERSTDRVTIFWRYQ